MKRPTTIVARGTIAGILAATALALWFLLIDAIEAQPFRTPAFLAAVLGGFEEVEPGFASVALYTLFHYLAFVVLGVVVTWLLSKLDTAPNLLLGFVLGFLLFDLVFYASIVITGVDVVRALGWPEVLAGNLLAGIVLMGYLHLAWPVRTATWWEALREHRTLREGIIAGVLGAAAVAVWFLLLDAVQGRVFFTPGALGSALYYGATAPADVQVTTATVLGYTVFHVSTFLLAGLVAAALVNEAEHEPRIILGIVLLFVTFETLFIGLLAILASWLLEALRWWTIAVANLIAALVIGAYLWREHPALRKELRHRGFEELEEPV